MTTPSNPEVPTTENTEELTPAATAKKRQPLVSSPINPAQYRAVRFVSFMLEDSKHEISPTDFLKDAIARHLAFYQTKRGIEFPNKMLAELTKLDLIPSKSSPEE